MTSSPPVRTGGAASREKLPVGQSRVSWAAAATNSAQSKRPQATRVTFPAG